VGHGSVTRPFEEADAPVVVGLLRELMPEHVLTVPGFLHRIATKPARAAAARWAADEAGEIVGFAAAEREWVTEAAELGSFRVWVRRDARGGGVGAALYERVAEHLRAIGVRRADAPAAEDDGRRFLEARGFQPTRTVYHSVLDPRTVDREQLLLLEREKAADGFTLTSLSDLSGREREVYAVYAEAVADMPADEPETNLRFDEWRSELLADPDLAPEGSFVVLADTRPVSFAFLEADREQGKAVHEQTGTLREFRGRSLARLAKLATIRWAAEQRISALLAGNDGENAPMLTLNRRLGYMPIAVWTTFAGRV
jgi:GNAT superfamily N-acetyltransferase